MLKLLDTIVKDKNVLILGFGREGKSTYNLLSHLNSFKSLTVADSADVRFDFPGNVKVVTGVSYQDKLNDFDIVIKSPGVVLEKDESEYRCHITSQTEIFFQKFSRQIIGITGTKGKSTTASLLYHVLSENGINTVIVGNIGVPCFDLAESIGEDTVIVFELSSHQLEYTKLSPHIAVLLNIYEEHLDHYGSFDKYAHAKKNIYKYQVPGDLLLCNIRELPAPEEHAGSVLSISEHGEPADISLQDNVVLYQNRHFLIPVNDIRLIGHHNYFNIAVVYAICLLFGLEDTDIKNSLVTYQPLPHRLQLVGEKDGIRFYDDSISTICETTIQALNSIPDVDTVLVGGMDRGIDYMPLADFLAGYKIRNIILMADTGKRIYEMMSENFPHTISSGKIQLVETLEQAVVLAKKITDKGKCVLLSPAAASYGIFKNFEERGEVFQKLCMQD